jgi:hypothetical protein
MQQPARRCHVTTNDHQPSTEPRHPVTDIDELFGATEPVHTAADLAHDGIFEDDEIDEFLTDLYAMRHSDVA